MRIARSGVANPTACWLAGSKCMKVTEMTWNSRACLEGMPLPAPVSYWNWTLSGGWGLSCAFALVHWLFTVA